MSSAPSSVLDLHAYTGPMPSQDGVQIIDLAEMRSRIDNSDAVFVMAMDQRRFDMAHIDGSISFDRLLDRLPDLDRDTTMIMYCTDTACAASKIRAAFLVDAGFTSVYRFPGGLEEWSQAGLPLVRA